MDGQTRVLKGGKKRLRVDAGEPRRVALNLSLPYDLVVKLKAHSLLKRRSISAMVEQWAVGEVRGVVCFHRAPVSGPSAVLPVPHFPSMANETDEIPSPCAAGQGAH